MLRGDAKSAALRETVKSAALRETVADLLSTREGTTYWVKKISGVTQRIGLPGSTGSTAGTGLEAALHQWAGTP